MEIVILNTKQIFTSFFQKVKIVSAYFHDIYYGTYTSYFSVGCGDHYCSCIVNTGQADYILDRD